MLLKNELDKKPCWYVHCALRNVKNNDSNNTKIKKENFLKINKSSPFSLKLKKKYIILLLYIQLILK